MSDHLSSALLNALADGEFAGNELASVTEHLHGCSTCTSRALEQSLLKSATARAGWRYALPDHIRERMERLVSTQNSSSRATERTSSLRPPANRSAERSKWLGWAVAAALLVSAGGLALVERNGSRTETVAGERAALVTEVGDQHSAIWAANLPPQVLSSDRHTVKPWFQGKIPFSFNLPENLPNDTKLDGANLVYLHNRPAAQLLYSIGKHRVSVLGSQKQDAPPMSVQTERSGFHVTGFATDDLEVVAISDVDP